MVKAHEIKVKRKIAELKAAAGADKKVRRNGAEVKNEDIITRLEEEMEISSIELQEEKARTENLMEEVRSKEKERLRALAYSSQVKIMELSEQMAALEKLKSSQTEVLEKEKKFLEETLKTLTS